LPNLKSDQADAELQQFRVGVDQHLSEGNSSRAKVRDVLLLRYDEVIPCYSSRFWRVYINPKYKVLMTGSCGGSLGVLAQQLFKVLGEAGDFLGVIQSIDDFA